MYSRRRRCTTVPYRHCEYQSFEYLQVNGEAQTVQPPYPIPPHWAH